MLSGRSPGLLACLACLAACATSTSGARPDAAKEMAPAGKLRAAINVGNPVLARRDFK